MVTEIVSLILIYNLSVQFKCNVFIRHMKNTNLVQIELIRTYAFYIQLFSFSAFTASISKKRTHFSDPILSLPWIFSS